MLTSNAATFPQGICSLALVQQPIGKPPSKMLVKFAVAASLVACAAAHATFQELWINGVDQGSSCVRLPQSNSPVTDITSDVRLVSPSVAPSELMF